MGTQRPRAPHTRADPPQFRSAINLPKGRVRNPRFLGQVEVADIAAAMDERYQSMVWIAAMLGLRWGEVAAIRVGSVDGIGRQLTISEAIARDGRGRSIAGVPKSQAGIRSLSLPQSLADELALHVARMGVTAADTTSVLFPSASGSPMSHSNGMKRGLPR